MLNIYYHTLVLSVLLCANFVMKIGQQHTKNRYGREYTPIDIGYRVYCESRLGCKRLASSGSTGSNLVETTARTVL